MMSKIVAALLPACALANDELFAVAAGRHFSFFVENGIVKGMGRNQYGQLGLGSKEDQKVPKVVPFDDTTLVSAVAAGAFHTLFLAEGGDVWVAGRNNHGQLGDGDTATPTSDLKKLTTIEGVAGVAAGYAHSIFLMENGLVKAVGLNNAGQLGDGTTIKRWTPVDVTFGRQGRQGTATAIACGYDFTYLLDSNGELWGMGQNLGNQLGTGFSNPQKLPQLTLISLSRQITAIAAGESHGLFRSSSVVGRGPGICATGANFDGQLGFGSPSKPRGSITCVADDTWAVAAGGDSSCRAVPGYDLSCWGSNRFGQIGLGGDIDIAPDSRSVPGVEGSNDVAIGDSHSLFLNHDDVMITGSNSYGELGDGTTESKDRPIVLVTLERPNRTTTTMAPTPPTPAPVPRPTRAPMPAPIPAPTVAPTPAPPRESQGDDEGFPWEMLVGGIATGLGVVLVITCLTGRPEAQGLEPPATELADA